MAKRISLSKLSRYNCYVLLLMLRVHAYKFVQDEDKVD